MHGTTDDRNAENGSEQLAYSVPRAASVLDLSERYVWYLVKAGRLKSFKVGESRRIRRADLEAFIAERVA